jgi:hypothetical protein
VIAAAPSQKLGTNVMAMNWLAASDRRPSFRWAAGIDSVQACGYVA